MNPVADFWKIRTSIMALENADANEFKAIISELAEKVVRNRAGLPLSGRFDASNQADLLRLDYLETLNRAENYLSDFSNKPMVYQSMWFLTGIFAELTILEIQYQLTREREAARENGSKGGKCSIRMDMLIDTVERIIEEKPGISPRSAWEFFAANHHVEDPCTLAYGEIGFTLEATDDLFEDGRLYQGGIKRGITYSTFYQKYFLPLKK